MATEYEFKYILALEFLNEFNEETLMDMCSEWAHIKQGYIVANETTDLRIRYMQPYTSTSFWTMTFKYNTGSRVIEVERRLEDRDGQDLWDICTRRVSKVRYFFPSAKYTWELDVLKRDEETYFILAEVELPEGSPRPQAPPFFEKYVLYEVDLTDTRFSNKKLGDVEYATDLYRQIKQGGNDGHES